MKRNVIGKLITITFFSFVCLLPFRTYGAGEVATLKISSFFPVGQALTVAMDEWGKDLEKRTNGRVKVNHFPAATLTAPVQIYESTVKGIADIGDHCLGYTMGRFPLSEALDLPMGYPNAKVATKVAGAFYKKFKPKELDDVKVLWMHAAGSTNLLHTRTKAVEKMEDLKGLKIRTFGTNAKFIEFLGGTPVAMPMGEVYDSLSKGVVEGLLGTWESLYSFKTGEQVKYTTENYGYGNTATFVIAMNKAKFNSLPPDIQKIIDEMGEEYSNRCGAYWDRIDQEGREWMVKRGQKIINMPKQEEARWVEKAKPLFDEYLKKMKDKNLPGEEATAFIRQSIAQYSK